MTTTRSAVLKHTILTVPTGTEVVQVPSGQTWIIKSIIFNNSSANTGNIQIYVSDANEQLLCPIIDQTIAAGTSVIVQCWVVLGPGEWILANTKTSNVSGQLWVSGSKLQGVAT